MPNRVPAAFKAMWLTSKEPLRQMLGNRYFRFMLIAGGWFFIFRLFHFPPDSPLKGKDEPAAVIYYSLPFLFVLALWRSVTAPGSPKLLAQEQDEQPSASEDVFLLSNLPEAEGTETFLSRLEASFRAQAVSARRDARRIGRIATIFLVSAIFIPIMTWCFAASVASQEKSLSNFWALTFSSLSAGSITVAIGVTFLRHTKALQDRQYFLRSEVNYIRRIRAVFLASQRIEQSDPQRGKYLQALALQRLLEVGEVNSSDDPADTGKEDKGGLLPMSILASLAHVPK